MKDKTKNNIKAAACEALTSAEKILVGLWDIYDDMSYGRIHPRLVLAVGARRAREIIEAKERCEKAREKSKAIWQLKRNKWIKQLNEGRRIEYAITMSGRIAAYEALMRCSNSVLSNGNWCLVVFDFPEAARRSRGVFRRMLKRIGFECVQLSVWRTRKDLIVETRNLVVLLKIDRWVQVYSARST